MVMDEISWIIDRVVRKFSRVKKANLIYILNVSNSYLVSSFCLYNYRHYSHRLTSVFYAGMCCTFRQGPVCYMSTLVFPCLLSALANTK